MKPHQGDMKLKRVLGFTTNGRNSFLVQPNTGNIIYIAGCIVVILNPQTRSQNYLITNSKQSIITLAISQNGQYLAAANCGLKSKCTIYIWDLKTRLLLTEFNGYEVEISSMCFSSSKNSQYLVSVGSQHDMVLSVWDWRRQVRLMNHIVPIKIRSISFASDDTYFVTVGEAYVKYWYLNDGSCGSSSNTSGSSITTQQNSTLSISSQSATLGEQKSRSFCDVKCGRGRMSESTFCITKDGLLCELNKNRLLHKWVDLRTPGANCLAVSDNIISIGCANGVIRCFNTTELRFLKNLPRPHTLGLDISASSSSSERNNKLINNNGSSQAQAYPDIIAIGLEENLNTISCVHNDRSLYSWDLNDPSGRVVKRYSALYHSSCIWGIDTYPEIHSNSPQLLPLGSFITCSSDGTLRIWNPTTVFNNTNVNRHQHYHHLKKKKSAAQERATNEESNCHADANNITTTTTDDMKFVYPNENPFSEELYKIVFTDSTHKFLCDLDGGEPNRVDLNYDSNEGLRCLKISPSGKQLAVGNRSGAIKIFDFELDKEIKNIAAHDAEVLCLEYSNPRKFSGYCYLASSSRDKLIHIFDASNNYTFLQTIDDHLSSITALRFVNSIARDCLQLISCGADQRIIFRNGVRVATSGELNFVTDQRIEGKTTFYDMEVDSESSCLMTACQDRTIRLFNVAQVRYQSGFKGSPSNEGTLIKIALDPSCTFLATSSTDKSISVYDYQRGECLASVIYGLSDLITGLRFSHDGRHLIACSGDGCIFIWRSPAEIAANAMGSGAGESGSLSLAQLSLSPCSSERSLTKPPLQLQQQDQLAKEQIYEELRLPINDDDDNNNDKQQRAIGNGASTTQTDSRYQVVQSNSCDESARDTLNLSTTTADGDVEDEEEHSYVIGNANKFDIDADADADNDNDYATLKDIQTSSVLRGNSLVVEMGGTQLGMQKQQQQQQQQQQQHQLASRGTSQSRYTILEQQRCKLAKAKLFQSRENLERITLREKFLNEGLAHGDAANNGCGGGGGQVSKLGGHQHHQSLGAHPNVNNCVGGGNGNSSLSGLFNTKLNGGSMEQSRLAENTSALFPSGTSGSGNGNNPASKSMSNVSHSNNNNNNDSNKNNTRRDNLISPPGSSSKASDNDTDHGDVDDELSSDLEKRRRQQQDEEDKLPHLAHGPLQRPNRPITPPKPSLHRQIRRGANSASGQSQHSNSKSGLMAGTGNSSSSLQRAILTGNNGSQSSQTSASLGRTRASNGARRLQHHNHHHHQHHLGGLNLSTGTTMASIRSARSECDLVLATDQSLAANKIGSSGQLNNNNNNNSNNNSNIVQTLRTLQQHTHTRNGSHFRQISQFRTSN